MWPNVSECQSLFLGLSRVSWGGGRKTPKLIGRGGKEPLKQTGLHFAVFLLYFKPVLNGRPVTEWHRFVPIDSQLGGENFSAAHCRCKYLANC